MDQRIARASSSQQRSLTRAQLLTLGLTDNVIARRVRVGQLHREHRGVYSVGTPAVTPHEHAMAAVLACGPSALLSHFSALALWGFAAHWPTVNEVTVTAGDPRPTGIRVHRTRTLDSRDRRDHFGIPVTSPARALIDCAPRLQNLTRTVNDALHSPYLTDDQLRAALARHPTHAGAKLIRRVMDGQPTRSDFEDEFLALCREHGFPEPVCEVHVNGHLVDAYFPRERVVVECDGWEFHRLRAAFEADRDRDADHVAADVIPYRLTWERLRYRPEHDAERLGTLLARRRGEERPAA